MDAASANARLIPTEDDPSPLQGASPPIDKSLPPTPAPGANGTLNGAHPNGDTAAAPAPPTNGTANAPAPTNGAANAPTTTSETTQPAGKAKKSGKDEKKELMDKMQPPKGSKPIDAAQQKGDRWAKDPVTGGMVLIRDPDFKDFRERGLDNEALDPDHPKEGTAARRPPSPSKMHPSFPAPAPAEPGNICNQPFPPEIDEADLSKVRNILRMGALVTTGLCFVTWLFTACGKHIGWFAWFFRSTLVWSIAAVVWIGVENAVRKLEKEIERVRLNLLKKRAEVNSPPTPESVEWMNAIIKLVWGLVNPDMFIPIVDMVEDVLQASLPSFVDAVRIADIGQGTNPVRIVSMRALPDQPGHPDYPREEWVGLNQDEDSRKQAAEAESGDSDDPAKQVDTDQTGDYLNYEVSISYQALPGQQKQLRFHNMHMMLEFFIGAFDWFKIPIPIYTIVEGFVATARFRVQFVQNPPFVRNLTVTLMGVPKVAVSVEPFTKKLPNILDLPMIQKFVEMGIAAACAQFIAPKSLTINLAQMLAGDGVKKDTKALGVFVITIHHAVGLDAQDTNGKSDPYIVLAYAKFGKPLYSTRIIQGDLNPVWEETAVLLLTDEEVKGEENLTAMLWDSDKRSADDLVGRVTIPVVELMKEPGKMHARTDKLHGFEDANDMPGTLHWEIGYFDKVPLNKALKKEESPNVPAVAKGRSEKIQEKPTIADSQEEADALRTPPDPAIPSGILSVIVHQINNLERQDIKGASGSREGQAGQDTAEPSQEGENLPSSYCEIIINDDMIYKTRVKQYSSMPYFEAGTERFIRDWRETVVRVQVRDARVREKDPVLGIVTVKLSELFKNASEVTRLFSLQEGVGYGRANISFMFRQVATPLPRTLLGWETGTLEVLKEIRIEPAEGFKGFDTKKLEIVVTDDSYKVPSSAARAEGGCVVWDPPVEKVRLPVYNRYSSAVVFEIGSGGIGPLGADCDFIAACWFKDVPDDEETQIRVPVIKSPHLKQLRQNYINDQTKQTHEYEIVGWLTATVVLDSGLDPDHEDYQQTQPEKHRYEAYDRVEGQAQIAERTAQIANKDDLSKGERKELDAEKQHQLAMRHRGVMQYQAARTSKWSKEGLKKRVSKIKDKITGGGDNENHRGNTVETEA
ncbi:C2 domain-containing protein [Phanerochaete sordida]|uniref:C2 domain-containing protein n=1 Tax=Phanerochaete sordida TaxID=48140 RepID=A0A9P3LJL0_9APHY|nr:C2 domain-containing protein [Phanerochaete sordida]